MRVCTGCAYQRLTPFKRALAPAGGLMFNFGLFAACVCAQVMCRAFGVAEKLPLQGAEEMTKSSE